MSDIHIDDFYKDSAKILLQLYRTFPRKHLMFVEDICGPDTPDEYGLHSDRHNAGFSTMLWLAEAGYITYEETVRQEAIDQATLTHKAFTLLSARAKILVGDNEVSNGGDSATEADPLPSSVQLAQQTNINQLRQALKSGSSTQIGQLMQQLMVQSRDFL